MSLENFWQLPQDFLAFNGSRECIRIFKVYFWSVLLKVFLFQKVLKICDNFYKFSFNGSRSGNSASLSAPAASVRTKSNLNWWRKSFGWKWKIVQVSYAQPFCSLTGCFDKLFSLQSKGGHAPSYDNCYVCLLAPTRALIVTVVYYPAGVLRRRLLHRNGNFVPLAPWIPTRRWVKTGF